MKRLGNKQVSTVYVDNHFLYVGGVKVLRVNFSEGVVQAMDRDNRRISKRGTRFVSGSIADVIQALTAEE